MVNKEMEKKQQLRLGSTPITINTATVAAVPVNGENGKKATITLNEAKKKGRSSAKSSDDDTVVKDIYQNVSRRFSSLFVVVVESFPREILIHHFLYVFLEPFFD